MLVLSESDQAAAKRFVTKPSVGRVVAKIFFVF